MGRALSSFCSSEGAPPSLSGGRSASSREPLQSGVGLQESRSDQGALEVHPRLSYKEALLASPKQYGYSSSPAPHCRAGSSRLPRSCRPGSSALLSKAKREGLCFRCLARDHQRRDCRDPPRCLDCLGVGHVARRCRKRFTAPLKMQRVLGFRPPCMKAFVPYSDGFLTRQEQRRNALIAHVTGPARLGHFPQDTIATDLATRFGGFANDFLVTKYRQRDFILFLPSWVRAEELASRDFLRLPHCKLRVFPWNPYGGAPRSRITFKAWITIVNLPFECWSEARVAAIVSGFGRFLQADDATINFHDLAGFRYQVAVDELVDILDNLAISMGDIVVTVPVRLESTAPFGGDDRGVPFVGGGPEEGGDQTDPLGRRLARRIAIREDTEGASDSREGAAIGQDESWNSSEIRDRRRGYDVGGVARRGALAPAAAGGERHVSAGSVLGPRLRPRCPGRFLSAVDVSLPRGSEVETQPTVDVGGRPRVPRGRPRLPPLCSAFSLARLVVDQGLYSLGPSLFVADLLSWGWGSSLFLEIFGDGGHARRAESGARGLLFGAYRLDCRSARAPCALGDFVGLPTRQVARSAVPSLFSPGLSFHLDPGVGGRWDGRPWASEGSQVFGRAVDLVFSHGWAGGKPAPSVGGLGPLRAGAGEGASGGRLGPAGIPSGALRVGFAVVGPKLALLAISLDTGALRGYPIITDASGFGSPFHLAIARGFALWASPPPADDPSLWFRS